MDSEPRTIEGIGHIDMATFRRRLVVTRPKSVHFLADYFHLLSLTSREFSLHWCCTGFLNQRWQRHLCSANNTKTSRWRLTNKTKNTHEFISDDKCWEDRRLLPSRRFCTDEFGSVRLRNSSLSKVQFGWLRSNGWTYGMAFAEEMKREKEINDQLHASYQLRTQPKTKKKNENMRNQQQ